MMTGWNGWVLRINLSDGSVSRQRLNQEWAKDYIGSRGLGARYLVDGMDPQADPLGPGNKLVFATGPLTGTAAPGGGRYMVVTKSPLTGGIANSNAGGFFPAELKFAGYDIVIFEGKAKAPVYVWIDNDTVQVRDASHLWGKTTIETEKALKGETSQYAKVACIGPGGENLVRYANIINDGGRAAGRSGVGAVMGSKRLKAVVVRGSKGVKVARKDEFRELALKLLNVLDNEGSEDFYLYGTPGVISLVNESGVLPTKNFQEAIFPPAEEHLYGEIYSAKISKRGDRGKACFGCPIGCGRTTAVDVEPFQGEGEGPEYESVGALGPACGIDNLYAIAKANYICNEMGLDTISTGMTIACAMEMFEKGYLTAKDVGRELRFGDYEAMLDLVDCVSRREGFGDVLAEGSYRMAEKYGCPELSMTSKKQEYPCYDARGLQGLALQYATQSRGGDHIRGETQDVDLYEFYHWNITSAKGITHVDRFDPAGKPLLAKEIQDWFCCIDSSGMCNFVFALGLTEQDLVDLLNAAGGDLYQSVDDILQAGERIFNLERLFNLRAGLSAKDDTVARRMLEEPVPAGPAAGQFAKLDKMLPEYYSLRGWDSKGVPSQEKLEELGLAGL